MKHVKNILLIVTTSMATQAYATVYENAEDEKTSRWSVYDNTPSGAHLDNVYLKDRDHNAIQFIGAGTNNGYILGNWEGAAGAWNNTTEHTLKWSMNFDEDYVIYVRVMTKNGPKYIYYTASDKSNGKKDDSYIHIGLGRDSNNGSWQDFNRDLEADLKKYEPNNELIAVNAFLVRGNGLVDDVELYAKKGIDSIDAYQKDNKLILGMNGNFPKGNHISFFIDADNNTDTGYSNEAVKGADYLVEDSKLYEYPSDAQGWKWNIVSNNVETQTTQKTVKSTIEANLLNMDSSIKLTAGIASKDWSERIKYHVMEEFKLLDHQNISFEVSHENIRNPERGVYEGSSNIWDETGAHFYWIAKRGHTIVREELALNKFKNTAIPEEYLGKIRKRFDALREAGLKMVWKVSYHQNMTETDASLEIVLKHIKQLEPIYNEYEDVIAAIQAGFIGAWGEWHSSSHGLHESNSAKDKIKEALLNAVPKSRMVQFRNPPEIMRWYPTALNDAQAFTGSNQSRVGFHNDCFIANITEVGTYSSDANIRETQKNYMAKISSNVPIGGEICGVDFETVNDTRSCENALATASRFHYSYLDDWHKGTNDLFKAEGCWDELKNRLGYRFVLKSAKIPNKVNAGENFVAELTIKNNGFASPYNERDVYLVLENGSTKEIIKIDSDPRKWRAGKITTISVNTKLSKNLKAGNYQISLWMPDISNKIKNDPRYAIRTANIGTWNETTGYNKIGNIEIIASNVDSNKAIFIIGDSTVKNDGENKPNHPERGWGELLGSYMKTPSNIHNEALSGASTKSFKNPGREENWYKTKSVIENTDLSNGGYLLIQFGHNDESDAVDLHTEPGRGNSFYNNLKFYVNEAKNLGLIPVLITPVSRMNKNAGKDLNEWHKEYDTTVKNLAEDENILLLDLLNKSWNEFNKYRDSDALKEAFAYDDLTHFSPKGAKIVAGWVKDLACESGDNSLCEQFK